MSERDAMNWTAKGCWWRVGRRLENLRSLGSGGGVPKGGWVGALHPSDAPPPPPPPPIFQSYHPQSFSRLPRVGLSNSPIVYLYRLSQVFFVLSQASKGVMNRVRDARVENTFDRGGQNARNLTKASLGGMDIAQNPPPP